MNQQRASKKQRELLNFIDGFIKGNGYGPSYREIMRALDYKSVSTVAVHVDGLIQRGYLYKRDHSARSLEIAQRPDEKPVSINEDAAHIAWLKRQISVRAEDQEAVTALEAALVILQRDDE